MPGWCKVVGALLAGALIVLGVGWLALDALFGAMFAWL